MPTKQKTQKITLAPKGQKHSDDNTKDITDNLPVTAQMTGEILEDCVKRWKRFVTEVLEVLSKQYNFKLNDQDVKRLYRPFISVTKTLFIIIGDTKAKGISHKNLYARLKVSIPGTSSKTISSLISKHVKSGNIVKYDGRYALLAKAIPLYKKYKA